MKYLLLIISLFSLISCNVFSTKTKIGSNFFPKNEEEKKDTNKPLEENNTEETNQEDPTINNFPFELNFNDEIVKNSYTTFELEIKNRTDNEVYLNINLDNLKSNIVEVYNPCNSIYLIPNESCFIELQSYNVYLTKSILILQYKDLNNQIVSKEFSILIND